MLGIKCVKNIYIFIFSSYCFLLCTQLFHLETASFYSCRFTTAKKTNFHQLLIQFLNYCMVISYSKNSGNPTVRNDEALLNRATTHYHYQATQNKPQPRTKSSLSLTYLSIYLLSCADAKHSCIPKNFPPPNLLTGIATPLISSVPQSQPIKAS